MVLLPPSLKLSEFTLFSVTILKRCEPESSNVKVAPPVEEAVNVPPLAVILPAKVALFVPEVNIDLLVAVKTVPEGAVAPVSVPLCVHTPSLCSTV